MLGVPTKKLFDLTWVGWLNLVILQWFCMRLGYHPILHRWGMLFWPIPLTGWASYPLKFIGKPYLRRIS